MYHRVAELNDTPTVDSRSVSATPSGFTEQMRHLAKHYRVVSMPDVLDAAESRRELPERSVLITFDDAYADFADIPFPILRRFRLPATLFVPTAYPDHPELAFWWDRLYQAVRRTRRTELCDLPIGVLPLKTLGEKRRSLRVLQNYVTTLPHVEGMRLVDSICARLVEAPLNSGSVLSWDQLRRLAKEGVTLGSHTRTHPIMTQMSSAQIREEVKGSQQDLKKQIGFVLPIFCYPNGNHSDTVTDILREEGIRLAFTTIAGKNELQSADLLRLTRIGISPRTSLPVFRLRLLQIGIYLDAWRCRKREPHFDEDFQRQNTSLA